MGRLGLEGGVKATVYVRVKSSLGANIEPKYSNVLTISVTPYLIDLTVGYYLDEGQNETGIILSSPEANGIYSGFVGAASWGHFWLREGNGTIWGNDGVTGTAFVLGNSTTGIDIWNCWYPGVTGCYYVTVDTPANEWSALPHPRNHCRRRLLRLHDLRPQLEQLEHECNGCRSRPRWHDSLHNRQALQRSHRHRRRRGNRHAHVFRHRKRSPHFLGHPSGPGHRKSRSRRKHPRSRP